jgi:predicted phage terminase large subunit-like protein
MAADGVIWITDMVRGQWDTDEVDRQIRLTAGLDGHGVSIHGPQDPGAAGKKAGLGFIRLLLGFNVNVEPVSGHKQTRARGLSAQVNAGNVKMVKGNWNKAVIEEMRTFPVGKNDDIIDAASDATNEIAEQVPAPLAVAGAERSIPTQGIRDGVSAPAQQPVAGRRVVVNPGLAKVQSYRPR